MSDAVAWLAFAGCAAAIAVAGTALCRIADAIAERTGIARGWIGLVLLGIATSLPELATGISSVRLARAADIAVGDVLGSVVFNLALLGVVYLVAGPPPPASAKARRAAMLPAAFGVGSLAIAAVGLAFRGEPSIAGVAIQSPLLVLLYGWAMRRLYARDAASAVVHERAPVARLAVRFALAALMVATAATALPLVAQRLATAMGWSESAVGTLFVAGATSLPELAVTVAAMRMGRVELAVGNLLGSNLFDLAILAVDDLLFPGGPLLAAASAAHGRTLAIALAMGALALLRPRRGIGLALVAAYAANAALAWI
jgi:cation:H+ antiporter